MTTTKTINPETLTDGQKEMIKTIVECEQYARGETRHGGTYHWVLTDDTHSGAGVLGNLVKNGLAVCSPEGADTWVSLTDAGADAYEALTAKGGR